jgi:hypothetical protein
MNLTPVEAAARLRLEPKTPANWRNKRVGPKFRKFGRKVLYPVEFLDEWERAQTVETRNGPHCGV